MSLHHTLFRKQLLAPTSVFRQIKFIIKCDEFSPKNSFKFYFFYALNSYIKTSKLQYIYCSIHLSTFVSKIDVFAVVDRKINLLLQKSIQMINYYKHMTFSRIFCFKSNKQKSPPLMFGDECFNDFAFLILQNPSWKSGVNPHPLGLVIVTFQDFV